MGEPQASLPCSRVAPCNRKEAILLQIPASRSPSGICPRGSNSREADLLCFTHWNHALPISALGNGFWKTVRLRSQLKEPPSTSASSPLAQHDSKKRKKICCNLSTCQHLVFTSSLPQLFLHYWNVNNTRVHQPLTRCFSVQTR